MKGSTDSAPDESALSGLQMAAILLCLHLALPLSMHMERERFFSSSSNKGTNLIMKAPLSGAHLTLTISQRSLLQMLSH